MSRIEDLIQEHCPDGVPYKTVGEVADYIRGVTYAKKDEVAGSGTPVLRANNIIRPGNVLSFRDLKQIGVSVKVHTNQMLRIGDILISASNTMTHVGKAAYVGKELGATFGAFMAVIRPTSQIIPRFLFHLMTSSRFTLYVESVTPASTIANLNSRLVKAFRIPIPPFPVQEEIVRILDSFSKLEAELEAELGAELKARRQQFDYYRSTLLKDVKSHSKMVQLGQLGRVVTGRTPKASDATMWNGAVDFVTPSDIRNGMKVVDVTARHLSGHGVKAVEKAVIPAQSILVTCIGADMGKTVLNGHDCVTNQQINSIVPVGRVSVDYVFHVLTAMREKLLRQGERSGGTLPIINKSNFSKIEIPLPEMIIQNEVAEKLDALNNLANDLSSGLPAEITARRRQYEHYRDRLLSFEELSA